MHKVSRKANFLSYEFVKGSKEKRREKSEVKMTKFYAKHDFLKHFRKILRKNEEKTRNRTISI